MDISYLGMILGDALNITYSVILTKIEEYGV